MGLSENNPSPPVTSISGTGLVTNISGNHDWFQEPVPESTLNTLY